MSEKLNLKVTANYTHAQKALDGFSRTLKGASSSFNGASKNLNRMQGSFRNLNTDANRTNNTFINLNKTMNRFKMGISIYAVNRLAQVMSGAISSSMDMVETANLFNVAMGTMAEATDESLRNISAMSGLDLNNLRDAVASYTLLARSMGVSNEASAKLGKNITLMAVDLSSLVNVPFEQALADLKSGLVGQTETVYKYGNDLTEASLKAISASLGIEKSVRNMTQGEKMILRYIGTINSGSLAMNDLAKTINEPANQLRLLKENFVTLSRSIGSAFLPVLGSVLPYLRAVVMVLSELFSIVASLFGYTAPKMQNTNNSVGNMSDGIEGVGDSAEKTKKKIKDLQAPFDELNSISEDLSDSSSGGNGLDLGGIDQGLIDAMQEYDSMLSSVRQKANDIRDRIMQWLGFTKEVDEETGKVNWKLGEGYTRLEKIRDIVVLIGLGFALWKLTGLLGILGGSLIPRLMEIYKMLKACGLGMTLSAMFPWVTKLATTLGTTTPVLLGIVGFIILMVTRFYTLYQKSESFRKGIERIGDIFNTVWKVISDQILLPIWNSLKKIGEVLWKLLPEDIKTAIVNFFTSFKKLVDDLDLDFADLLITLGGIGLLFTPAAPFGIALLAFEAITLAVRAFGNISEEEFERIKTAIVDTLQKAIDDVKEKFSLANWLTILQGVKDAFSSWLRDMMTWWDTSVNKGFIDEKIKPVFTQTYWEGILEKVPDAFKNIFKLSFNGVMIIVEKGCNWIIDALNDALSIEIPDWIPEIGGMSWGLNIPPVKLPRLARGGVLESGQLFEAGENGKSEMIGSYNGKTTVMPLENTSFVSAVGDAVYQAMRMAQSENGGSQSIIENVLQLDGEVIYRNQQKVQSNKGVQLGNLAFGRG